MYIRDIHIDGFGIFHDKSITGLNNGLNVLFGPNEKGKSTLLAYIRRCLFGFPRSSSSNNPYPPLSGGAYGGRMVCILDSGDELVVARTSGPHGGRLQFVHNDETKTDQQALHLLLGGMSQALFRNVYAIGLSELEELNTLDSQEIKDRLYGADLGLGGASIPETRKQIEAYSESLFKPRGSSQVISQTYRETDNLRASIRELQNELTSYDDLYATRNAKAIQLEELESQIDNLSASQRNLEIQKQLYPEYISYDDARNKYDALPELREFHGTVISELDKLKEAVAAAEDEVTEKTNSVDGLSTRLSNLTVNVDLVSKGTIVNVLARMSDKYQSATEDLPKVEQKQAAKMANIESRIEELGSPLNHQKVQEHKLTTDQKEKFNSLSNEIASAEKLISDIERKRELQEENTISKAGSYLSGPSIYRWGIIIMSVVAASGTIGGASLSNWWLAGVSLLFLCIAGFLLLSLKWKSPLKTDDPLIQKLLGDLDKATKTLKDLRLQWGSLLREIDLPESIGPISAQEILAEIKRLQSELDDLEEYKQRVVDIRETIVEAEKHYADVSGLLDDKLLSGNILADITILSAALEEEKGKQRTQNELSEQLQTARVELNTTEENLVSAQNRVNQLIEEYGADDERALRHMADQYDEKLDLKTKIDQARRTIELSVGRGDDFDAFIESVKDLTLDSISTELDQVTESYRQLVSSKDQINQEIGSLNTKLEQLSSTTKLLDLQMELEEKLEQLDRAATEWVKSQIELTMLNAAVATFEETRQPQVIRSAEGVFSTITGGTYNRVRKPLEQPELEVVTTTAVARKVSELSRGTVEQLYLAMRMGLIESYEESSERMPVIIDDILVNFDDDRAALAAQAISAFAENRQVIAMTCHGNSRDLLLQAGGTSVDF